MMKQLISNFPKNIEEAITIAENSKIRIPKTNITQVVICGMGGSGIGGKIVSQWMFDHAPVSVQIIQDYQMPAYVGPNTLVIGSSYSGSTEETIEAIYEAKVKGAHIIGICSGGLLQAFCKENDYDCVIVPGGNPPRTALAFSIVQLTNIFIQFNFLPANFLRDLKSAKELIEKEIATVQSEAMVLAKFIKGKVPAIYSSSFYEGIAIRARQQFNENGKLLCWHHALPEMNHNELVGWGGGDQRFVVVLLQTHDFLPRNKKRLEITLATIHKKAEILEVNALGTNVVEKSIYLIHLVDWASFYLSELNDVDPMDIKIIDYLKDELSKF